MQEKFSQLKMQSKDYDAVAQYYTIGYSIIRYFLLFVGTYSSWSQNSLEFSPALLQCPWSYGQPSRLVLYLLAKR